MNYLITLLLAVCCHFAYAQQAPATKKPAASTSKTPNKYNDNVDDRMKGPNGEKIYIGSNGGRYYLKNGRKVYVPYKGNKKKKS
jgi:hypothetical protein